MPHGPGNTLPKARVRAEPGAAVGPAQGSNASRQDESPPECCIQLCGPQHKRDMDLFEKIQRRAMKMMEGLEPLS